MSSGNRLNRMAGGISTSGSPPKQASILSPEGTGCCLEGFPESSSSQSFHPQESKAPLQATPDKGRGRGDSLLRHSTAQSPRFQEDLEESPAPQQGNLCLRSSAKGQHHAGQGSLLHPDPSLSPRLQLRVSSSKELTLPATPLSLRRAGTGWQGTDKMPQGSAAQPKTWAHASSAGSPHPAGASAA